MEFIIGIIVFIAFGVITDAIEGNKKKGKSLPPQKRRQPSGQEQAQTRPPSRQTVPKIKAEPQAQRPAYNASSTAAMYRGKPAGARQSETQEKSAPVLPAAPDKNQLRPADIHSDVLLHAVAYAQILQPPKAYQYMATRSCRGDWNNNK